MNTQGQWPHWGGFDAEDFLFWLGCLLALVAFIVVWAS